MRPVLLRPPFGEALGQRLDRLALVQARTVNDNQLALAGGRRIECFSAIPVPFGGLLPPALTDRSRRRWTDLRQASRYAFFTSLWRPAMPRKRLVLPLRTSVLTAFTLTPNSASTAALISGLEGVVGATLKITWFFGHQRRLFGDHRRDDHVIVASGSVI
jgi:hypothetical protein